MGPISRWAVKRPWAAFVAWLALAAVVVGSAITFTGTYNDSFELPDTDSSRAQDLLTEIPGANAVDFEAATATLMWRVDSGEITDPGAIDEAMPALEEIMDGADVACLISPIAEPMGDDCPADVIEAAEQQAAVAEAAAIAEAGGELSAEQQQLLAAGQAQQEQLAALPDTAQRAIAGLGAAGVSADGKTAKASITFVGASDDVTAEQADAVYEAVADFNATSGVTAGISSQALEFAGAEPPKSEIYGVAIALIILITVFGSVVAGLLPIFASLLSVGVGLAGVTLIANGLDVATFAPTLAAMIGLGVGIDYALFVINRFQQDIASGRTPKQAALESVDSAGRAVVFAGATVIIALLGLLVTGISFFTGLALAASVTVLSMVIGATFVLPAFLSKAGMKTFALRVPGLKDAVFKSHEHGVFSKYAKWLHKNYKWLGPIALVALLVVAYPATAMRTGFPDASGKPSDDPARVAYELISEGFSPGLNGPFVIGIDGAENDSTDVEGLVADITELDSVDAAIAPPLQDVSGVGVIQVIPATGPQDEETGDLLSALRDDIVPAFESASGAQAYVGGVTAIETDFSGVLTDALPAFLALVVSLGFIMLMLLFRSILVPAIGALTSLLSLAASMGVVVAVFQWGWLAELFGVSGTGPVLPFVPIMVFAILFGLSMDYQVFLVSRMQEEWDKTRRNTFSIIEGLGSSGRVVAIAAAIMCGVFGSFIFEDGAEIKLFGVALTAAVLFDAFLIRLIIVPSLMFALGKANWWLPGPLAKVMPKFTIEGSATVDDDPSAARDERPAHLVGASMTSASSSVTTRDTADSAPARQRVASEFGPPKSRPEPFMAPPVPVAANPTSALMQAAGVRPNAEARRVLAVVVIATIGLVAIALGGATERD